MKTHIKDSRHIGELWISQQLHYKVGSWCHLPSLGFESGSSQNIFRNSCIRQRLAHHFYHPDANLFLFMAPKNIELTIIPLNLASGWLSQFLWIKDYVTFVVIMWMKRGTQTLFWNVSIATPLLVSFNPSLFQNVALRSLKSFGNLDCKISFVMEVALRKLRGTQWPPNPLHQIELLVWVENLCGNNLYNPYLFSS